LKKILKIMSALIVCLSVLGCSVVSVKNESYDSSRFAEFKNFQVPQDSARIYFKSGIFVPVVNHVMDHKTNPVLLINDIEFGEIQTDQIMVVNLKPGTYRLRWQPKFPSDKYDSVSKEITLNAGQYIVVNADLKLSGVDQTPQGMWGLIAVAIAEAIRPRGEFSISTSDQKDKLNVSKFIKPSNCPAIFCLQ
jgi:hypothetical protein